MSPPRTQPEHGSAAGYQRCKKRPGGACEDCKRAWAAYGRARYLARAQQAWQAADR